MTGIQYWKCLCGASLKAVLDSEPVGAKSAVACPRCGKTTEVNGALTQLTIEADDGVWIDATPEKTE